MRRLFAEHLKRVEWDRWTFPVRPYPFVASDSVASDRPIAIDPRVAFGKPVVVTSGISTHTIAERIDAGECVAELSADYGMSEEEIERVVLYTRTA